RVAPDAKLPHEFNRSPEDDGQADSDGDPDERLLMEHHSPCVTDSRAVDGPSQSSDAREQCEPHARIANRTRCEGRRRPPARDESRTDDEHSSALVQSPPRPPIHAAAPAAVPQQPRQPSGAPPELVSEMIAEHRT